MSESVDHPTQNPGSSPGQLPGTGFDNPDWSPTTHQQLSPDLLASANTPEAPLIVSAAHDRTRNVPFWVAVPAAIVTVYVLVWIGRPLFASDSAGDAPSRSGGAGRTSPEVASVPLDLDDEGSSSSDNAASAEASNRTDNGLGTGEDSVEGDAGGDISVDDATAAATTAAPSTTETTTAPTTAAPTTTAPTTTTAAPTTEAPTTQAPAPSGGDGAIEQEVLNLTNQARSQNGCPALALNAQLNAAADAHSEDMATRGYFSHRSPEGEGPGGRLATAGYVNRGWAENIAHGQRTAAQVVDDWMNSPGHRENILNCSYNALGVGYADAGDRSGIYWTQVFGNS